MSEEVSFGDGFFTGTAADTIETQSGVFATILREGVGVFLITMANQFQLQLSDFVGYQKDLGAATSALSHMGVIERVSSTQFRVRQFTKAGATDGLFGIYISRIFLG